METVKKYCAAPWRGLHLNFNGQIKTCCASESKLDTILGSNELLEVKQSIKEGILHKEYCKGCIEREDAGGKSERDWHNNISPDFDVHTADLNEHTPSLIDIRWTNTCNLACTYCSSYFSTKWASIIGVPNSNNINKKYQEVINYIDQHKEHVKEVALVGGEPLLMKENAKLLDILFENVLVTVISNMTVDFDRFPVPNKLLSRDRVGWSMSFDNVGKRFEYVRWGSTWEQLNKNVTVVSNKINNSNHHGGIHAVYNLYNCTRLCELKEYADLNNVNILWQRISGDHLDPCLHNNRIKQLALDEIEKYRHNFIISDSDKHFLDQTERSLVLDNRDYTQKFLDFTKDIETKWHPDQEGQFAKLWPELAEAL
jgi:hypothetical protein